MARRVFLSVAEASQTRGAKYVDVRWSLKDLTLGKKQYEESRIPGAVFFDLEELSGEITSSSGRHPLPVFSDFKKWLVRNSIRPEHPVIVYDSVSGGSAAARAWWMLTQLGYQEVGILETGFPGWIAAGGEEEVGPVTAKTDHTEGFETPRESWDHCIVSIDTIKENLAAGSTMRLIDARSGERYASTTEPSFPDSKPGHIEGAVNHPFMANFTDKAALIPQEELVELCRKSLGDTPAAEAVVYCGSGVTSCTTAAAIHHAGFDIPKVYVGSWSEWSKHM